MKIAICDDDIVFLHSMVSSINKLGYANSQISIISATDQLFHFLEEADIDILILDIDLGDANGIEVARTIKKQYPNILIIFITGYIDFAGDIFEADPIYFLIKPVKPHKLRLALDKTCQEIEKRKDQTIQIWSKGQMVKININDIIYIESCSRLIQFYNIQGVFTTYIKLSDVERRLPECFVRCHQSYLVNMRFISGLKERRLLLSNEKLIPISQSRYKMTIETFTRYLGGQTC